jgi:hypothetical protein
MLQGSRTPLTVEDMTQRRRRTVSRWTVSRWFHSNPLSLQCHDIFLCNTCCRYSMLNGIVDSRKVRTQKVFNSLFSM